MFAVYYIYILFSKLTKCFINMKHAMAAGDASQTTPVHTTHVFMLLCCLVLQIVLACAISIPVRVIIVIMVYTN